ncbi:hypothetical protein F5Y16DRAFT_420310 [Xylariaceae sp. FL0255]|nr:hypothetical protein F5Y16DRAFT_420310 [Xylariaceae sp. FL0255]
MASNHQVQWALMSHQLLTRDASMKMALVTYESLGAEGQQYFLDQARAIFRRDVEFAIRPDTNSMLLGPIDIIVNEADRMGRVVIMDRTGSSLTRLMPMPSEEERRQLGGAAPQSQVSQNRNRPSRAAQHHDSEHDVNAAQTTLRTPNNSRAPRNSQTPKTVYPPRPQNGFFMFKNWRQAAKPPGMDGKAYAKAAAEDWEALSNSQKQAWKDLWKEQTNMHNQLFPYYKFQPTKGGESTNARTLDTVGGEALGQTIAQFRAFQAAHSCPPGFTQEMVDEAVSRQQNETVFGQQNQPAAAQQYETPAGQDQSAGTQSSDYQGSQLSSAEPPQNELVHGQVVDNDDFLSPTRWQGPVSGFSGDPAGENSQSQDSIYHGPDSFGDFQGDSDDNLYD